MSCGTGSGAAVRVLSSAGLSQGSYPLDWVILTLMSAPAGAKRTRNTHSYPYGAAVLLNLFSILRTMLAAILFINIWSFEACSAVTSAFIASASSFSRRFLSVSSFSAAIFCLRIFSSALSFSAFASASLIFSSSSCRFFSSSFFSFSSLATCACSSLRFFSSCSFFFFASASFFSSALRFFSRLLAFFSRSSSRFFS